MKIHTIYVADLKSDNFLSMDLYAEDIRLALENLSSRPELKDFSWEILDFPSKIGDSKFKRLWQKLWVMPKTIQRRFKEMSRNDVKVVVHILDHSYGNLASKQYPSYVTCHDLANFSTNNFSHNYSWISHKIWSHKVKKMKISEKIFCISQNTQKDVINFLNVNPNKTVLNYYGRDLYFSDSETLGPNLQKVANLSKMIESRYVVFHCGHNDKRKNIPTLLRSFKHIREQRPDAILIKAGNRMMDEDPSLVDLSKSLGIQDELIETGSIHKDVLKWIYKNADIFIYPSIYEGFGRPLLEAQASGLPVICADSSCLREVAGDGAIYCETTNHVSFALSALNVINNNSLKQDLIQKGLINVNRFNWSNHVSKFTETYFSHDLV